mmetsp:Transcript_8002/g.20527  ORF Transcript_8002/g.20527 Transcript_8002/m.20527 type:complete len:206 (-) Transcript_8002:969-1586(-)
MGYTEPAITTGTFPVLTSSTARSLPPGYTRCVATPRPPAAYASTTERSTITRSDTDLLSGPITDCPLFPARLSARRLMPSGLAAAGSDPTVTAVPEKTETPASTPAAVKSATTVKSMSSWFAVAAGTAIATVAPGCTVVDGTAMAGPRSASSSEITGNMSREVLDGSIRISRGSDWIDDQSSPGCGAGPSSATHPHKICRCFAGS